MKRMAEKVTVEETVDQPTMSAPVAVVRAPLSSSKPAASLWLPLMASDRLDSSFCTRKG
jgi:hypothetical protein